MTLRMTDAKGRVKEFRNGLHRFAAANPFTFGTITFLVGSVSTFFLLRPG